MEKTYVNHPAKSECAIVFDSVTIKICCWDGGVCRRGSCDSILPSGLVVCCERHRNPSGRCRFRKDGHMGVVVFG